jgi:phosphohistidine phosphatase
MPRELLVLRHGKAFDAPGGDDFRRTLKDSGKRRAQRVGVWLLEQGLVPDGLMTSAAPRARVTAEKCCKAMGLGTQDLIVLPDLYLAGVEQLLVRLRELPESRQRVLLVGHNPGLSALLGQLSGDPLVASLKTASLARLGIDDRWENLRPGGARLLERIDAGDLPEDFPYPGPGGPERRPRPAYYYTQSAVVPYRQTADGLQILVIQSSRKSHWVLPKGIADPGLSLQASAAREALEEAGIEGDVHPQPLGEYRVEKWGAFCTVTAFPMAVTREIPFEHWEEKHRGRRWVTPAHAAILLQQPALTELVERLPEWLQRHD